MGDEILGTGLVISFVFLFIIASTPKGWKPSELIAFLVVGPFFIGLVMIIIGTLMCIWGYC